VSPHIDKVLKDYSRGKATQRELADVLKDESTSVRFESLLEYFQRLWPEAKLVIRHGSASVRWICPAQSQLSKRKRRLVRVLFDSVETFDQVSRDFFQDYPLSVLSLHDGRYAILDGHHRVHRWWELAGDEKPLRLTIMGTHNVHLLSNYRTQVDGIRRQTGSYHIRDLPIV
jgi:hypothetical protein